MFGGQEHARTVAVDRAAFEHPVGLGVGKTRRIAQPLADGVVAFEVIFLAPAVEAEALRAPVRARSADDRAGVAQPDVAELLDDHLGERREALRASAAPASSPRPATPARPRHRRGWRRRRRRPRPAPGRDRPPTARRRTENRSTRLRAAPIRAEAEIAGMMLMRGPSQHAARVAKLAGLRIPPAIVRPLGVVQGDCNVCAYFVRCAAAACSRATRSGAPRPAGRRATAFGARESVGQISLSPDGTKVVYPRRRAGQVDRVVHGVRSQTEPDHAGSARMPMPGDRCSWCGFACEQSQLLCRYRRRSIPVDDG